MMGEHAMHNKLMAALCQSALEKLCASTEGIVGGLVTTLDGFSLAAVAGSFGEARMAAMSSTMHALAEQMVGETGLGQCRDVIVEAEIGWVLLLRIPECREDLILCVVSSDAPLLGNLLWVSRQCARKIGERLAARHG